LRPNLLRLVGGFERVAANVLQRWPEVTIERV
jgi:hypothetical protein